ncbi:MAG: ester cyclase [Chloroflexota bacterium]
MNNEACHVLKRFIEEAFNTGNVRILPEVIAPDHVSHLPTGDVYGPEGVRIEITGFRSGFPDLLITLIEIIPCNEYVVYLFTARGTHLGPFLGIPPTGHRVQVEGIGLDRFQSGKVIERWVQYDSFGLLQQLGVLPGFSRCCS